MFRMTLCLEQDFYNLVDVYLDAVFFPKCVNEVQTFQQEGWHYELNDPAEDITFKGNVISLALKVHGLSSPNKLSLHTICCAGVVFNEMKGVYSQPESVLGRITQQVGTWFPFF